MSKRANRPEQAPPKAEVAEARSVGANYMEWPSAIRAREWVDADGTRWRPRSGGGTPPKKRLEHLLASPEVRVLHFYGPDAPTAVALPDREALWQRVRSYLREPVVRASDDYTDFRVAKFRDERRRSLLVIEESC
ncbi:hypothetical protein GB931_16965 [Modestobacter sp. I12A-02628]|uniref:Uncharacterized protein n=1 Tax=Goekera deserti TaxID=2497753 RepID=A0A7K3WE10_9ACTN|nr:hypothetical protein [Goekera deserti]MPQ99577.1 hypothetical protein [Goekera deserti]NDI46412.1 hypothetical protein [Goekera deserti]NEL54654.1 hypothetical protein [Goekera deserti]